MKRKEVMLYNNTINKNGFQLLTFNLQNAKTWDNTSYKHEHGHNNSAKKRHNINVKEEHERYNNAKERHNINTKKNTNTKQCQGRALLKCEKKVQM
jgi:hypothetical protein